MATTRAAAYIANSQDTKWTEFDIRVEFNTHAEGFIVAATEVLLSVSDAEDLIKRLKEVLDKFAQQ